MKNALLITLVSLPVFAVMALILMAMTPREICLVFLLGSVGGCTAICAMSCWWSWSDWFQERRWKG
jgi:hypothetical protein